MLPRIKLNILCTFMYIYGIRICINNKIFHKCIIKMFILVNRFFSYL